MRRRVGRWSGWTASSVWRRGRRFGDCGSVEYVWWAKARR